jgi:transcriptional regulator with XRE-family HTH domain
MKPKELRYWLKTKGLTQGGVALLLGVSRPLVTSWLQDHRVLPLWLDYVMDSEQFNADVNRMRTERYERKMTRPEKRR